MSFIAGTYTATWNGLALGQTEDGFELEHQYFTEVIRGDTYGDTDQDGVYRGGNVFVNLSLIEWDAAAAETLLNPFGGGTNTHGTMGLVGRLMTNIAAALVLTDVTGLPSETDPAVLTASKAIIAPNFSARFAMANRLRRLPLRLQLFPFNDSGTQRWYIYSPT